MFTTFLERAKRYKEKAAAASTEDMKEIYLTRAEQCIELSKEPVLIDVGVPCGFCGSTEGRSNDEGRGDGWYRCLSCQGN